MLFSVLIYSTYSVFDTIWDRDGVEFETNEHKKIVNTPRGLTNYVVPNTCEVIYSGSVGSLSSFYPCSTTLKSLSFEKGSKIRDINGYAFISMNVLESVDFSNCNYLTIISNWLFTYTESLKFLILPPKIEKILSFAFYGTSIDDITLPDSCIFIGYQTFSTIKTLKTFHVSETSKLQTLDRESFALSNLTEFYFPEFLSSYDGSVFGGQIVDIKIHKNNQNFKKDGVSVLTADGKKVLSTNAVGHYDLPKTVVNIPENSFRWSKIETIKFHGPIESTGNRWFAQSALTSITIPDGLTYIAEAAFDRCENLTSCTLTDKVTVIAYEAFNNCSSLKSINLLKVEEIGNDAFKLCTSLTEVALPSTLTKFGQGVFSRTNVLIDYSANSNFTCDNGLLFGIKAENLTAFIGTQEDIVIPEKCTSIGIGVFRDKKIKSVTFKNTNPIYIECYAFANTLITSVNIPTQVIYIANFVFQNCSQLTSVTISSMISNTLQEKTFYNCSKLEHVSLPSNLATIKENVFMNCTSLTTINLKDTSLKRVMISAFELTGITNLELPSTFTTFDQRAFAFSNIQTLDISSHQVTAIPDYCFKGCTSLRDITFSNNLTEIGIEAFCFCSSIESIVLPQTIEYVRAMSFYGCARLNSISLTLDCNLKIIYGRAFSNCSSLKSITVDEKDSKFIFEDGVLLSKDKTKIVFFLPSSKIKTYVVPSYVEFIGPNAFEDCVNIQNMVIPDGRIREVGFSAFSGCTGLKYVYLPKSLEIVGNKVFDSCTGLRCGSIECPPAIKDKVLRCGYVSDFMFADSCTPSETACYRSRSSPRQIISLTLISLMLCL